VADPDGRRSLLGRTVAGTVGAARRRVEGEVAGSAQSVIEDLEPYLAAETVPRVLEAIEPYLAAETVPRLVDAILPHLVEHVVPQVVDALTEHLATRTVPDVLSQATPELVETLVPDILEGLRPYLETELAPALVDALTPHLVEVTAPQVVHGLMPLINAEVVPAVLDGVADDPRIRALVREQSWGLVTDGIERFRRLLADADDAVERLLRRLLRRRAPVEDVLPRQRRPLARERSHAGIASRVVGDSIDLLLVTWLGSQALAAGLAVLSALLGEVPQWLVLGLTTAAVLLGPVYLAIAWRTAGCSVGGFVAGYSISDGDGRIVHLGRAVVRAALAVPLWAVWFVGLVLGVVDPARRGLLDRLTGTRAPYRGMSPVVVVTSSDDPAEPGPAEPGPADPAEPGPAVTPTPGSAA
jgi:hypothetical protein